MTSTLMKVNKKEVCLLIHRGANGSMLEADSGRYTEDSKAGMHGQLWEEDGGEKSKAELETSRKQVRTCLGMKITMIPSRMVVQGRPLLHPIN